LPFNAPAYAEGEKPLLHIEESTFEFGSVSQGTVVKHEFTLENKGSADLEIQRVVAACGCTASSIDSETIAPGENGKIQVEFNTAGFSGEKLKTVRVYTNDQEQPSSLLSLKGRVEPAVSVVPARVYFGNVTRDGANSATLRQEVKVQVREGEDVKVKSATTRSKHLKVEVLSSDSRSLTFAATLSPEVPLGEFRDRVVISLQGAQVRSMNVPVFASVKGPLQMKPGSVAFGVLEGTEKLVRSVKLENKGKAEVEILNITSNHPAVEAEFSPIKSGKVYVIKVSVQPEKVKKDLRASLQIETSSEKQQKLQLSVYGILPPKL
jgi:hypothetical protein